MKKTTEKEAQGEQTKFDDNETYQFKKLLCYIITKLFGTEAGQVCEKLLGLKEQKKNDKDDPNKPKSPGAEEQVDAGNETQLHQKANDILKSLTKEELLNKPEVATLLSWCKDYHGTEGLNRLCEEVGIDCKEAEEKMCTIENYLASSDGAFEFVHQLYKTKTQAEAQIFLDQIEPEHTFYDIVMKARKEYEKANSIVSSQLSNPQIGDSNTKSCQEKDLKDSNNDPANTCTSPNVLIKFEISPTGKNEQLSQLIAHINGRSSKKTHSRAEEHQDKPVQELHEREDDASSISNTFKQFMEEAKLSASLNLFLTDTYSKQFLDYMEYCEENKLDVGQKSAYNSWKEDTVRKMSTRTNDEDWLIRYIHEQQQADHDLRSEDEEPEMMESKEAETSSKESDPLAEKSPLVMAMTKLSRKFHTFKKYEQEQNQIKTTSFVPHINFNPDDFEVQNYDNWDENVGIIDTTLNEQHDIAVVGVVPTFDENDKSVASDLSKIVQCPKTDGIKDDMTDVRTNVTADHDNTEDFVELFENPDDYFDPMLPPNQLGVSIAPANSPPKSDEEVLAELVFDVKSNKESDTDPVHIDSKDVTSPKRRTDLKDEYHVKVMDKYRVMMRCPTVNKMDDSHDSSDDFVDDDKTWKPKRKAAGKPKRNASDSGTDSGRKKKKTKGKKINLGRGRGKKESKKPGDEGDDKEKSSDGEEETKDGTATRKKNWRYEVDYIARGHVEAVPIEGQGEGVHLTPDQAMDLLSDDSLQTNDTNFCNYVTHENTYRVNGFQISKHNLAIVSHRDQFNWKQNGNLLFDTKKGKIHKWWYASLTEECDYTSDYMKIIYAVEPVTLDKNGSKLMKPITPPPIYIIQYIGDESVPKRKLPRPEKPASRKRKVSETTDESETATIKRVGTNNDALLGDKSDANPLDVGAPGSPTLKPMDDADIDKSERESASDTDYHTDHHEGSGLPTGVSLSKDEEEELKNNELAQYAHKLLEEGFQSVSSHVPIVANKNKKQAKPALILETPETTLHARLVQEVMKKAVELGKGINDGNETFLTVPCGGQVYIFDCKKIAMPWPKLLKADGYRFRHTKHAYPKNLDIDMGKYYAIDGDNKKSVAFKKYTYYNTKDHLLAIHYYGSADIAGVLPHGNATKRKHPFFSTAKSVALDVVAHPKEMSTTQIYHELTANIPAGDAVRVIAPRNPAQVKYAKAEEAKRWMITGDEVRDTSIILMQLGDDFSRGLVVSPHFAGVFATKASLEELDRICSLLPPNQYLVLHYDTTFKVGNQSVSILMYRHPFLETIATAGRYQNSEPLVPLFFMVHHLKSEDVHVTMFKMASDFLAKKYPHLKNVEKQFSSRKKLLISDREFSGEKFLPNTKSVYCWNHLEKNLEFKTRKLSPALTEKQVKEVKHDFKVMETSTTEDNYLRRRNEIIEKPLWTSTGLKDYYLKYVDKDFRDHASRWFLLEVGIDNGSSGITNNPSETVNSQLKKLYQVEGKGTHMTLLQLHQFQSNIDKEVTRAYCQQGTMMLKKEYIKQLGRKISDLPNFPVEKNPEEFLSEVRKIYCPEYDKEEDETPKKSFELREELDHVEAMATYLCDSAKITPVPGMDLYYALVDPTGDTIQFVDLNIHSCSCEFKGRCAHLLAIKKKYKLEGLPSTTTDKTPKSARRAIFANMATPSGRTPRYGLKTPSKLDTHNIAISGPLSKKIISKKDIEDNKEKYLIKHSLPTPDVDEITVCGDPEKNALPYHRKIPVVEVADLNDIKSYQIDDLTLRLFQGRIFTVNGIPELAMVSPLQNRVVLITKPDGTVTHEQVHLAALAGRRHAIYTGKIPKIKVFHAQLLKNNQTFEQKIRSFQRQTVAEKKNYMEVADVELGCYCRQPMKVEGADNDTLQCNVCDLNYHLKCLNDRNEKPSVMRNGKIKKCLSCTIPTLIQWSKEHRVYNTCTIDNDLQTLLITAIRHKYFLENLPRDEGHDLVRSCIADLAVEKCAEAQEKWFNYVRDKHPSTIRNPLGHPDLWGNPTEIFHQVIETGGASIMTREYWCENTSCIGLFEEKFGGTLIFGTFRTPEESITKYIHPREPKTCQFCHTGQSVRSGLKMDFDKKAWHMEFLGGQADSTEEIMDLADFELDGEKFTIANIVINQPRRAHFVSLQKYDNSWLLFDGIGKFGIHTRPPMPSDYARDGVNESSLTSTMFIRRSLFNQGTNTHASEIEVEEEKKKDGTKDSKTREDNAEKKDSDKKISTTEDSKEETERKDLKGGEKFETDKKSPTKTKLSFVDRLRRTKKK